ncbi:hypothetical protein [Bacillus sp. Marseille-P3800]|uniref:hypothetical protein n=1 Tax=Bacillus sp. Marseille-P3800 TaxID=2014782 RepID=UPI000C08B1EF|nr:hypothetical protein [Bacillus sp. Marseille-P3800]
MAKRFQGFPPPRPPPGPPKKFGRFKFICLQCLPPILVFQLIRTLLLPTAVDLFLLTLMIVFFICLFFGIV